MKIADWNKMMSYLVRPSREKIESTAKKELGIPQNVKIDGHKLIEWINYNQKAYGNSKEPMTPEERKTGEDIEKVIANTPIKEEERFNDKILKRDKYEPKKKTIIKKEIKVVEKPKPSIQEQLNFQDHLNTLDPYWWIEDEEEPKPKVYIHRPQRTAQGIQTILNLHKGKRT